MTLVHQGHKIARKFFTGTSSTYDTVVNIATFRLDSVWKRALLDLIPQGNYKVLDLACGTGILSLALARKVGYVVGVDITEDSVRIAKGKALAQNVDNVSFYVSAAEAIPMANRQFDFVTASYLPKYCDIEQVIAEICRVLKPGGMLIMHDFTYPKGAMLALWKTYFGVLRAVGVFTPAWRSVFRELDDVIRESNWLEELVDTMTRYHFRDIQRRSLTFNTAAIVWGKLV
ncbi:MAG: class I SAM-dependent methyltransferase [Nitrososphaerales archaeon]